MMHNEISDYLRMIDDADNAHSPTSRAVYADALILAIRDYFTDDELIELVQAKAENIEADKDAQVGQIMRMEEGIKKAKQMFKNIEIITSCPETGNERNAMQMAIDGHRLMVALLGGKDDEQT